MAMAQRTTKRVQDYISIADDVLNNPNKDKTAKHKKLSVLWEKMSEKDQNHIKLWLDNKLKRRGIKRGVNCPVSAVRVLAE